jgi:SAM-dependent methyltransferase
VPFPYHDHYWLAATQFIKEHHQHGELLLAPDEFVEQFSTVHSYDSTFVPGQLDVAYPWVVIHKGRLGSLHPDFLQALAVEGRPVFANEVFVVFATEQGLPPVDADSAHLRAFEEQLAAPRTERPQVAPAALRPTPRRPIGTLSLEEVREEMNRRYRLTGEDEFGGYEHPHLWDRVRFREVDRLFQEMLGSVAGKTIVELACGLGRNVAMIANCREYLGLDLSDVAIARAREVHGHRPNCRFERMDAQHLALAAERFDLVLAIEMIEHVHDPVQTIREAHRVLKSGGRLLINSVNRDSLHLRMLRKLSLPDFKQTTEHIYEFSYAEMTDILNRIGFDIERGEGVFLLPYFGIPDVDTRMRPLTDDDPEVVEIFRRLGAAAGPEFGYEYIIDARKR